MNASAPNSRDVGMPEQETVNIIGREITDVLHNCKLQFDDAWGGTQHHKRH